jgi:hypothetical protein
MRFKIQVQGSFLSTVTVNGHDDFISASEWMMTMFRAGQITIQPEDLELAGMELLEVLNDCDNGGDDNA